MIFYANRTDGLGERLKAMLNALVLAKARGGTFSFNWRPRSNGAMQGHAVLPVEEMFSSDFIGKYFVSDSAYKNKEIHRLVDYKTIITTDDAHLADQDIVLVTQQSLNAQINVPLEEGLHEIDYGAAFSEISFSPRLEVARSAAFDFDFESDHVAVHMRAGDIVYGRHRYSDRFHGKVVVYPLVEEIIGELVENGNRVIVFGQDKESIACLQERYDVASANELMQPFNFCETQKAIFEICLMSKCRIIFAGSSGFAGLASWIGNSSIKSTHNVFSADETASIIIDFVRTRRMDIAVPKLQTSFACRVACVSAGQAIPMKEPFIDLLDIAIELDPKNDFYSFIKACSLYCQGKPVAAEEILFSVFDTKRVHNKPISYVLQSKGSNGVLFSSSFQDVIMDMADRGYAMAALCAAISQNAVGQVLLSKKYLGVVERECPSEWKEVADGVIAAFKLSKSG